MKCPICLERLKGHGKTYTTECNHTFHKKCFGKLQNRVCPCCIDVIPKDKKTQILEIENKIKVIIRDFKRDSFNYYQKYGFIACMKILICFVFDL